VDWTIRTVLAWAKPYLQDKGIDTPRLDAELLLSHALNIKRIDLYLDMDRPLIEDELGAYRHLLKRRADREPVAYILGEKEFYSRTFLVNKHVLVPRPETEALVEQAIQYAPAGGRILEVGVGSGAVIISVLAERKDLVGFGNEISRNALGVAKENVLLHGVSMRMHLFAGNAFSPLKGQFPLILMNPPYIAAGEAGDLQEEVLRFEPHSALFGGNDGLDIIKDILLNISGHLSPGGKFIMEAGYRQKQALEDLVRSVQGIRTVSWVEDLSGTARVIIVERTNG
jgi:release factor glutamine methyltransferase